MFRTTLLLTLAAVSILPAAAPAQVVQEYVTGLRAPMKTLSLPDGSLLVSEAGAGPNTGRVSLVDRDGRRFTVVDNLPSGQPAAAAEEQAPPAAQSPVEARALRILLVDDHDAVRETTAGMLCDMGHQVEAAADGPTMLRALEAAPSAYDLIITDYAMPQMSGGDMLKQARKLRPNIPGIIISGYADSRSARDSRAAGGA